MSACDPNERLVETYRRGRLSFLQYIRQATPYAGPADRALLDRVRELAADEAAALDALAGYLDDSRITVPHLGAFPTAFTNYNFVAIRKLLPELIADETRGLDALEHELATLPPGEARMWVEKLAEVKRMHRDELAKLAAPASGPA